MNYERKMRNLLFVLVFFLGLFLLVGYGQISVNESKKTYRIDQQQIKYKLIKIKPILMIDELERISE